MLRNNLGDKNAQRGNIIQIEEFLDKNQPKPKLSQKQQEKLNDLINTLSDYATLSAKGVWTYEVAKEEILSLLPLDLKKKILNGFVSFESGESGSGESLQDKRQKMLETIAATIYASVAESDQHIGENEIAKEDYQDIVKPNICKIANEYQISTQMCSDFNKDDPNFKAIPDAKQSTGKKTGLPGRLKVLLWIVGLVVLGFIGLVTTFAIKAKLRERIENNEE